MENVLENIIGKAGYIIDMDDVIYHGNKLLPGVTEMGSTSSLSGALHSEWNN